MGAKVALGVNGSDTIKAVVSKPTTLEEKVKLLTLQIEELTKAFHALNSVHVKNRRQELYDMFTDQHVNKDGIPIGTSLLGVSTRGGIHVLTIKGDKYYIGEQPFDSLSAAAEASSGVRRSGWTYWKLSDGRTVREAFGKT